MQKDKAQVKEAVKKKNAAVLGYVALDLCLVNA